MKRMDLFCTTPASTAVYTSLEPCRQPESVPRQRIQMQLPIPCTTYQLAITPRPKKNIIELGRRKSSADARDLISRCPTGSSRYLLSDKAFAVPDQTTSLVPVQKVNARHSVSCDGSPSLKASSYSARSRNQVVVLRVSLHCKGCESKVRKHLSRMEGVRSFSIDFEKKVVTVKGVLTPLTVLASVSRVKNAQLLWPTSIPTSSSPSSSSSSWSSPQN